MYAVAQVRKFVEDHPSHFIGTAGATVGRAMSVAKDGVFSADHIEAVLGDRSLIAKFDDLATMNPEYMLLGLNAMRKSGF